jgi:hypothetical protein
MDFEAARKLARRKGSARFCAPLAGRVPAGGRPARHFASVEASSFHWMFVLRRAASQRGRRRVFSVRGRVPPRQKAPLPVLWAGF